MPRPNSPSPPSNGQKLEKYCLQKSHRPAAAIALWAVLNLLDLGSATTAVAQLNEPVKQILLREIEQTRSTLSSESFPRVAVRSQQLVDAHSELVGYLSTVTSQENSAGWTDYFDFEPLLKLVESLRSEDAVDAQAANRRSVSRNVLAETQRVYWRLTRNLPGLERTAVTEMRGAIESLKDAVRFSNEEVAVKRLDELLVQLADLIQASEPAISTKDAATINFILPLIEPSKVAPRFVDQLRTYIGRPNVRVSVGNKVIQRIVTRPVYDAGPNSDCILGTRVISQTQLGGQLNAVLIPNPSAAQVQLVLNADFNSRGTGYNSGVKILNHSYGPVRSIRDLYINDGGVAIGPVQSTANLQTQILGIQHPLKIVRRIAGKKAAQQKSQANRIAESKLESRVTQQFEQQSSSQISQGNLLPKSAAENVLLRLDFNPPKKYWSTSPNYLVLQLKIANNDQITTAVAPPEVVPGFDAVIQVHESAINNPATHLLAGRTLTDAQVREFFAGVIPAGVGPEGFSLGQLLKSDTSMGEAGAVAIDEMAEDMTGRELGLSDSEDDQPDALEITFAQQQPLIFEARDGTLRLGLNVRRITRDGETLQNPSAISATFKPVRTKDGSVRLERVGEIDVFVQDASKDDFNVFAAGVIARLRGRFGEIFPKQLLDRQLTPDNAFLNKLSPDPLQIKAIKPRQGWLTIYAA